MCFTQYLCLCSQVGAGGLGVSLPRRSWRSRLFVSHQSDQGRWPGLQQRGQLHVTAGLRVSRWLTPESHDHCTKHTAPCTGVVEGSLPAVWTDWWMLGRIYWLEVHLWQIWTFLFKKKKKKNHVWPLPVVNAISVVVFCTVFSWVWMLYFWAFFERKIGPGFRISHLRIDTWSVRIMQRESLMGQSKAFLRSPYSYCIKWVKEQSLSFVNLKHSCWMHY